MTVNINAGNISSVRLVEQSSAPSTPTSGSARLYANNESLPKLSLVDDGGTVTKFLGNSSGSGTGITFPATQDPSSNANTLDDYEEGTWTPALSYATPGTLSVAYSNQTGRYTRIGRIVHLAFDIRLSAFTKGTASGALIITGIPVAMSGYAGAGFTNSYGSLVLSDATFSSQPVVGTRSFNDQVSLALQRMISNSAVVSLDDPNSNAVYIGTIIYEAA